MGVITQTRGKDTTRNRDTDRETERERKQRKICMKIIVKVDTKSSTFQKLLDAQVASQINKMQEHAPANIHKHLYK